jgi:hypothetical protein
MKKLSLKNLKLEANDMLQRNQLKSILGGHGGEWCNDQCTTDDDCPDGMMGVTYSCKQIPCDNDPTWLCVKNK